MSFSSGVFTRLYNWVTENASPPIEIAKLDAQEEDFATALSNCILRDGTGVPTAATPWNSQNLTGVGTIGSGAITSTGAVTGTALIPSSSTVPANGVYLPAANTVGIASNTTLRGSVNSTGNWTIAASSSGSPLSVAGSAATNVAMLARTGTTTGAMFDTWTNTGGLLWGGIESSAGAALFTGSSAYAAVYGTQNATSLQFGTNAAIRQTITSAGNVTIAAPSSGTSLTVNHGAAAVGITLSNGSGQINISGQGGSAQFNTPGAWGMQFNTNSVLRFTIGSAGNVTIAAPTSGTALSINGAANEPVITGNGSGSTISSASSIHEPLYGIEGLAYIATQSIGTFTGTLTGCTTSPTATFNWTRVGNIVMVDCVTGLSGTSNSTSMTVTGAPSILNPSRAVVAICRITDNTTNKAGEVSVSGGVFTFASAVGGGAFTSSGTKGVTGGCSFSYAIT